MKSFVRTTPLFTALIGYRVSNRRILEVQARLVGRYLAGEITRFPTFVTR